MHDFAICVMLTGDTVEDSCKQMECGCCGKEASAIAHAAAKGQIAGSGDRTVVGDLTKSFALVVSTIDSVKSTGRAPKTLVLFRTLHDTRDVCNRNGARARNDNT